MLKSQTVLFVSLFFFLFNSASGQNSVLTDKIGIYAFISYPQGDFGATLTEKAGYANTGVGALAEFSKPLNGNIYWTSSLFWSMNSFDGAALQKRLSDVFVRPEENYRTIWLMSGLSYEIPLNNKIRLYVTGQSGILFSHFPEVTVYNSRFSLKQNSDNSRAFAYGFGAGLAYDFITFGFRYNSGEPVYEFEDTSTGNTEKVEINLPVSLLLFYLGICF